MSLLERVLRAAAVAFPRAVRERIGNDVVRLSLRRVREARARRGSLSAAAVAAGCLLDLLARGIGDRVRGPHSGTIMDSFVQDLRHAVRSLARSPRFAAGVVGILALGIGANTAIFSVVHGVVLRPLPFPEADRFVHVGADYGGGPVNAHPLFRIEWLSEHTTSFSALSTYRGHGARVERDGRFEAVRGLRVDAGFLDAVGYAPARGRAFTGAEAAPDGPDVVILSDATWRTRFGADPDVLGRALVLNERPYTVVGVLPADFAFPQAGAPIQYLVPLAIRPDPADEGTNYPAIGRLAAGVSHEAATADLAQAWDAYRAAYPELIQPRERGPVLSSFEELHVQDVGTVLWMMMAAVAVVLLIACANVANLLLARAAQRRRDVAVRSALGATRGRIVRQLLTEGMVLSASAATLGVLLAHLGVGALVSLAPVSLPRADQVGVSGPVLLFALAATAATGLVFGLAAALPALRGGLERTLREGSRGTTGGNRLRQALIAVQAAFSITLLVGAGLLVGTVVGLRNVDPGFDAEGLLAVSLPIVPPGYDRPEAYSDLVDRVRAATEGTAGPARVAATSSLPLERGLNFPVAIEGRPDAFEGAVEWRAVGLGYFELLDIEVLAGRVPDGSHRTDSPPVVVVSRGFADHYFPDEPALGQRIEIGRWRGEYLHPSLDRPAAEIVAVVADVRDRSPKQAPRRTIYVPFSQVPLALTATPVFLVEGDPGSVTTVRSALENADARLPTPEVRPMDDVVARSIALERFNAQLLAALAASALLLTAVGVYGVIACTVNQRRREMGIRVALGAARTRVVGMIIREGMTPVLLGLVLGGVASLWLSRLVSSLVWGIAPDDPRVLGAGALVLVVSALLASWIPARQATRLDPARTLGVE